MEGWQNCKKVQLEENWKKLWEKCAIDQKNEKNKNSRTKLKKSNKLRGPNLHFNR
jgi:hypothetical protein